MMNDDVKRQDEEFNLSSLFLNILLSGLASEFLSSHTLVILKGQYSKL